MSEEYVLIVSLSRKNGNTLGLLSSRSSDGKSCESGNEDGGELHFECGLLVLVIIFILIHFLTFRKYSYICEAKVKMLKILVGNSIENTADVP